MSNLNCFQKLINNYERLCDEITDHHSNLHDDARDYDLIENCRAEIEKLRKENNMLNHHGLKNKA